MEIKGESELWRAAAEAHAAMAELVRLATEFDAEECWAGDGIRSCSHWMTINLGLNPFTGDEVLRVGRALAGLPLLRAAFERGQLSFDKVRSLSWVATPEDEDAWLNLALSVSGTQLGRVCREVRHLLEAEQERQQRAGRGLWTYWGEDGSLRLRAQLPPEDGAAVLGALQAVAEKPERRADAVADPEAEDPGAAARADALVAICEHALASGTDKLVRNPELSRVVLHVDAQVLSGEAEEGLCRLAGGPRLTAESARRLSCDAELMTQSEVARLPVDLGRARRSISKPLRRALHVRDRGCRFPSCPVPAGQTHAHHLRHWAHGGEHSLPNLISLCGFHHRRLHEGAYRIVLKHRELRFERSDGSPIVPVRLGPATVPRREVGSPVAADAGRMDFGYVVDVMLAQHPRAP